MSFLFQFFLTVKRLLTNFPALLVKIGVFIILTLILGSVFSSTFNPVQIKDIKVAYVMEDEGEIAANVMDALVKNEEIGEYLSFYLIDDLALAEDKLAQDEYKALMYIQDGFSKEIMDGGSPEFTVYMTSFAGTDASVIKSCIQGFLNQASLQMMQINADGAEIEIENISLEEERPDSMTYYSIAMLLMMLFYGAAYGNSCSAESYFGAIGDRLSIAPVKRGAMFMMKMLGTSLVNFFLGCVIVLFTSLAFKVNWGNNYWVLFLILFEFSLLSTVFGSFLCFALGNEQRASSAIQMFALGFTIVSGGFYAGNFNAAKYFSFNHYAKTAITNLIYNGSDLSTTWKNAGILLIIMFVLIIVCIVLSRKRKAGSL